MKIDGIEVVDARKPLSLKIGKKDIGRGSVKNPYVCAAARAIMRQVPNATQAKVHMSKIYIKTGKKWTRYQAPASLRTEIVSFDRGGAFEAGEYLLALNIYAHHPLISAAKGAPVNTQLMDPVASAAGTISVVKDAPHPHAAMLLLDYMLSREGQKILADAEYFPAHPDVPPLPQLAGIVPKAAGFAENYIPPQQLKSYIDSTDRILQNLFR